MIGKFSSSAETQETEVEYRIMELVNLPSKTLHKRRAKSLVNALNLTSSIGFQPRPLIMFLTLRLIFDSSYEPLVKYSFGLVRGLYKEYLRTKNPAKPRTPRRSYRLSQNLEVQEFQRKTTFDWICSNEPQDLIESPSFTNKSSNSWQSGKKFETNHKQVFRSLTKIFLKFFLKRFQAFRHIGYSKVSKKTVMKNFFIKVNSMLFRPAFNLILRFCSIKKLKENSRVERRIEGNSRSTSFGNQDFSQGRRMSFEMKDKELWRKRHPVRTCSPLPVSSRFSLVPNTDCISPILPIRRKSLVRKDVRRNTVDVMKKFDTFGPEPEEKQEVSEDISEPSVEIKPVLKKSPKNVLRSGKKEEKKIEEPEKHEKKVKKPDFFASQPLTKAKKMENMVKALAKNAKAMQGKALVFLHQSVQSQKAFNKSLAAKLLLDFLTYKKIQFQKSGKKSAFESIKKESLTKKPEKTLKKPEKKTILRAGRPDTISKVPDPERGKKLLGHLDFIHTSVLKTKLVSFLAIIEASDLKPSNKLNPACKSGLRSIFRILETKRFLKICRIFHSIKRKSSQFFKLKQKKYLKLSQVLDRVSSKYFKAGKKLGFEGINREFFRKKANYRLGKALMKIENRVRLLVKPIVWYSISSFMKKQFYNDRVRMMKVDFLVKKIHIRKLASAFV